MTDKIYKQQPSSAGSPATRTEIPDQARKRQLNRVSGGFAAALDPASPTVQDLPTIADHIYDVGDEIARGGLGRILRATDTRLNRTVAIKELALPHAQARARFAREVLITGQLAHPNIIPLHEAGRWSNGTPFYSMKLVDGASLAQALRQTEGLDERLGLLHHVTAIAEAMAYAHNQRIIHRDLKPANVLVGPFGETVVIDWGLAKDLAAGPPDEPDEIDPKRAHLSGGFDTSDGAVLGTPAYMPPEQAAGDEVDERADVYALGAILYQLLSGARPYSDVPPQRLLASLLETDPRPVAEIVPRAPRDLCAIVDKAMARRPDDRYATAGDMADELKRFDSGRQVGAYDYSAWELLSRFAKRARGILVTAAIALTALAVVGGLAVRQVAHERDHARAAATAAEESRDAANRAKRRTESSLRKLKLEQARSSLATDPTRAARLISELGQHLATAESVLAEAQERGVAQRILHGPKGRIRAIALGGELVIAGADDGIFAWPTGALEAQKLTGHDDRVSALAFSPDGKRFASGSYDRTVRVWNADDLKSVELTGHRAPIKKLGWLSDQRLVSIDADGAVLRWDIARKSMVELRAPALEAKKRSSSRSVLALAPGLFAVADRRSGIQLWTATGDTPRAFLGARAEVSALALCSEGTRMFSGHADGSIWRWQLATGSGVRLGSHRTGIAAIACSADGAAMSAVGKRGTLLSWRADTDSMVVLGAHAGPVTALAMSADGALAMTASTDKSARIWRHRTGDFRELLGHGDTVSSLAFDSKGQRLTTASHDMSARVWKLESPSQLTLGRHSGGVRSVSLAPDGTRVASAGRDGAVGMWRLDGTGGALWAAHTDIVYRVLFSPDGTRVASSSDDQSVRIWNAATGTQERALWGHRDDVEELAFSPDGRWLASASKDNTAWLWDLEHMTGRVVARHKADVSSVLFSPNGDRLVSTGRDQLVRVYSLTHGTTAELRGHEGEVLSAAFASADILMTVGADDRLRRWDLETAAWTRLGHSFAGARHVRVAGQVLAVAGRETAIVLCDRNGENCRSLRGHTGPVEDLALSADGAMLVSASADGTVRVWSTTTGEHRTLRGHQGTVFDVELGANWILSAGADGRVIRWQRPSIR